MTLSRVEAIANAVLYEGYMLYPYRPSAIKNRQRFNFGVVAPAGKPQAPTSSELSSQTTECLVQGSRDAQIDVEVRFLQLVQRDVEAVGAGVPPADKSADGAAFVAVESMEVDGRLLSSWQEAIEQRVRVGPIALDALVKSPTSKTFDLEAVRETEPVYYRDGQLAARFVRGRQRLHGGLKISAVGISPRLLKVTASISNTSDFSAAAATSHDTAMLSCFLSVHKVLRVKGAEFVSLTDPPDQLRESASCCKNVGTWPVLAGEGNDSRNVLLSSPIILYDYPEIAPESAGDLFDGTEIDEILALRILTMTEQEKREMRSVDARTRAILERTEVLAPEHFMKLHGGARQMAPAEKERA